MRQRFVRQSRFLMVIVVILFIGCFLPSSTATSIARVPQHLLETATSWATGSLHRVGMWVRKPGEQAALQDLATLQKNNEELSQFNQKLIQERRELNRTIRELTRMRQMPAIINSQPALIPAGVTGYLSGATPGLLVDVGDRHDVKIGQAVVADTNLVGRVVAVRPNGATVGLITSPGTLLDVRVIPVTTGPAPREQVLQIQPHDDGGDTLFVAEGSHRDGIKVGDVAYLRLADNVLANEFRWPAEVAGRVVGAVVKVKKHPDDPALRTLVWIKPRVSLKHLTRLIVIAPRVKE
jgi:cell shape-determining protein MreC